MARTSKKEMVKEYEASLAQYITKAQYPQWEDIDNHFKAERTRREALEKALCNLVNSGLVTLEYEAKDYDEETGNAISFYLIYSIA